MITDFEAFVLAIGAMLFGIILLIKGGDWTVDAAVYVAVRFGISPMVVGFTIVAVGTSFPELVVSFLANFQGSGGIAIGNVIGSNIANILLVLGATAFFVTLKTNAKSVLKDLIFMLIATGVLTVLLYQGEIGRLAGLGMVTLLLAYIFLQYKMAMRGEMQSEKMDEADAPEYKRAFEPYLYLFLGLIAVAVGAEFLVRGAKVSAAFLNVPEAVIALSIIAFGTSLPELSTCIIAGRRGQSDMVLGNIIGSNVFNIFMIIGVTAMAIPFKQGTFDVQLVNIDIWVVVAVSVIFSLLLIFYNKINKPVGIVFMLLYLIYNVFIYAIYV